MECFDSGYKIFVWAIVVWAIGSRLLGALKKMQASQRSPTPSHRPAAAVTAPPASDKQAEMQRRMQALMELLEERTLETSAPEEPQESESLEVGGDEGDLASRWQTTASDGGAQVRWGESLEEDVSTASSDWERGEADSESFDDAATPEWEKLGAERRARAALGPVSEATTPLDLSAVAFRDALVLREVLTRPRRCR